MKECNSKVLGHIVAVDCVEVAKSVPQKQISVRICDQSVDADFPELGADNAAGSERHPWQ